MRRGGNKKTFLPSTASEWETRITACFSRSQDCVTKKVSSEFEDKTALLRLSDELGLIPTTAFSQFETDQKLEQYVEICEADS